MGRLNSFAWNTGISLMMIGMAGTATIAQTNQPLSVVYPPDNHETTASQIFLIGTAPAEGEVQVNGEAIARSPAGHFAPSFPLQLGENVFTLRYQDEELVIRVNRLSTEPPAPVGTAFAEGSLTPAVDIARLPNEPICFSAIAPTNATVSVNLGNQTIPLLPQNTPDLPPNSAVLTLQNQPVTTAANNYQGCGVVTQIGNLGQPQFELTLNGETIRQSAPGTFPPCNFRLWK
jgi:N-acetylmuramoyl-L-alanine amidase